MKTERPLGDSKNTGPADASGRCFLSMGPLRAWERWHITILGVTNTSPTKEPVCKIYQGSIAPSNLINGTYAGRNDTDPNCDIWLETGETIWAEWTAGDVGSVGTLSIRGTVENGV